MIIQYNNKENKNRTKKTVRQLYHALVDKKKEQGYNRKKEI